MKCYKPELLDPVTYVARELGYTRAMFVHGLDGLDEISMPAIYILSNFPRSIRTEFALFYEK